MNKFINTEQQDDNDDNHFFDVQALSSEDLDAICGAANCGYLGVHDYGLMMSYSTRNYSC